MAEGGIDGKAHINRAGKCRPVLVGPVVVGAWGGIGQGRRHGPAGRHRALQGGKTGARRDEGLSGDPTEDHQRGRSRAEGTGADDPGQQTERGSQTRKADPVPSEA